MEEFLENLLLDPAIYGLTLKLSEEILSLSWEQDEALSEYLLTVSLPQVAHEVLNLAVAQFRPKQPVRVGHPHEKKVDGFIIGEDPMGRPDWLIVSLAGPLWPGMDMGKASERSIPVRLVHTPDEAKRLERERPPVPRLGREIAARTKIGKRVWIGMAPLRPKAQAMIRDKGGRSLDVELREPWKGNPAGTRLTISHGGIWSDAEVRYYAPYVIPYEEDEAGGYKLDPRLEEIDGFLVFPDKDGQEVLEIFKKLGPAVAPVAMGPTAPWYPQNLKVSISAADRDSMGS